LGSRGRKWAEKGGGIMMKLACPQECLFPAGRSYARGHFLAACSLNAYRAHAMIDVREFFAVGVAGALRGNALI
jgi:hypothetical protein